MLKKVLKFQIIHYILVILDRFLINSSLEKRILTVENILIKEIAEEELGVNYTIN